MEENNLNDTDGNTVLAKDVIDEANGENNEVKEDEDKETTNEDTTAIEDDLTSEE